MGNTCTKQEQRDIADGSKLTSPRKDRRSRYMSSDADDSTPGTTPSHSHTMGTSGLVPNSFSSTNDATARTVGPSVASPSVLTRASTPAGGEFSDLRQAQSMDSLLVTPNGGELTPEGIEGLVSPMESESGNPVASGGKGGDGSQGIVPAPSPERRRSSSQQLPVPSSGSAPSSPQALVGFQRLSESATQNTPQQETEFREDLASGLESQSIPLQQSRESATQQQRRHGSPRPSSGRVSRRQSGLGTGLHAPPVMMGGQEQDHGVPLMEATSFVLDDAEAERIGNSNHLSSWLDDQLAVRVKKKSAKSPSGSTSASASNTIGGYSVSSQRTNRSGLPYMNAQLEAAADLAMREMDTAAATAAPAPSSPHDGGAPERREVNGLVLQRIASRRTSVVGAGGGGVASPMSTPIFSGPASPSAGQINTS